jgi:hypothetical protein
LFEAAGVRLIREVTEPVSLAPEDWQVLVTLVQPFTFDFLEARVGRGGAVRIFHTLHRLGVAEAIENDDDESAWLDQLADGVANGAEPTWLEPVTDDPAPRHAAPEPESESVAASEPTPEPEPAPAAPDPEVVVEPAAQPAGAFGVSAPASTTLTDGVYDEIRRLRSKVSESK